MPALNNKVRILIVDDEPVNLILLEDILTSDQYHIISAENGNEALVQVKSEMPDLILLDVMMPEVDGFEVCRRLKADETTRWIPIIILTALGKRRDYIKGLDAGADDFVTKPFNDEELLARIRNLLRVKTLNDKLVHSYNHINRMSTYVSQLLPQYHPFQVQVESLSQELLDHILKTRETIANGPDCIWISFEDRSEKRQKGTLFKRNSDGKLDKEPLELDLSSFFPPSPRQELNDIFISNCRKEATNPDNAPEILREILSGKISNVRNFLVYSSNSLMVIALNYNKDITDHEVTIFRNALLNVRLLSIISKQIDEVSEAFQYTIGALARAAEANDEDTGNHINRVGNYSTILAKSLGCSRQFVQEIGYSAQMHDVGKIHVHPEILKKQGKLTPREWEEMKKHTLFGPKILGNSPKLTTARDIALHHHEKWDGSGYPHGLKNEDISLAGRIVAIADIYDALRSRRSYKQPFSHKEACRIILQGDDRVKPIHFDPKVLRAFQNNTGTFMKIYKTLKDEPS